MAEHVALIGRGIVDYGWRILYASMIFFALELVFGHNTYSMKSRLRGAFFWVIYIVITVAALSVFNALWAKLGVTPLFNVSLAGFSASASQAVKVIGWIVGPVIAVLVGDFFYYWFHRAQHTFRFLWIFHSEHHAIREMSAWNSVHHISEEILRAPFIVIPMSLLIHVDPGFAPAIVWILLGIHGQYVHSHARLHFGPLRYAIADNRFHRIHHSVEREHFNKNFGSFSSVWDSLFGTAHFPKKDEWPQTGIDEHDEAKTVSEYLFRPFRKLFAKA
jgi:sterol desaturase/sphingolipid hydroxylase (fatty acid hydroxylase superfamily)